MTDSPDQADRARPFSTHATSLRKQAQAWLLAGCTCLSLATIAQEAEPIARSPAAPAAPASANLPATGTASSPAPAPRATDLPALLETPLTDQAGGPPVTVATAEAAATDSSVEGLASYYASKFAGRRTASGEVFDPKALTMAHRSWPFGTAVRVTHLVSGRSVVVRVNDRGPHIRRRVADLSPAAARALGMLHEGITRVRLEVLPRPTAGR